VSYTEHRYTSHDGLSLYYRAYGEGPRTVLCLPGLTRNSRDFTELATRLADRYRVLSPDLRGRGFSDHDPNPAHYAPGTYVRDVWTLLDGLGIDEVAVVGTSLGGLMAMLMADQQPRRLAAAVLNDIGPELPKAAMARILEYVGRRPPVEDWDAATRATREAYELAMPGMDDAFWADHARRSYRENPDGKPAPDMDPAIGDAARKAQGPLKVLRFLRRLGLVKRVAGVPIDLWDAFAAMTMPTLLVHGALSDVLTAEIVAKMRARKPDLEVATVPGRGHAPMLDEPEARAAIEAFLAAHYPPAA